MANLFDTFVAYKFIKLLATPFDKTDAFKLGIIDADGNILKPRKSLINSKDKKAYPSNVYTLVWNLKKILMKIPIVKSRVGQFASALYLLKEETGCDYDMLLEAFSEHTGINKQELVLNEQGKAQAMADKKIILEGHITESPIDGVNINEWDTLDMETRVLIAENVYNEARVAAKIASKTRSQLDTRTFDKLTAAVIAEGRYGDAELVWDDMPEDERFDVAEIAFGASKGKKISKMKWGKVSPADKKKVIATMEAETDGLVTIREAALSSEENRDKHFLKTKFAEAMVKEDFMNSREIKYFLRYVDMIYDPRDAHGMEAHDLNVGEDIAQTVIKFCEEGDAGLKAPKSFWARVTDAKGETDERLVRDAKKYGWSESVEKKSSLVERKKESAKDHWRRISQKGVVQNPIDTDRFPNREKEGLEGPYRSKKSGLIYYYDTREGKYYDPQSDMYLKVSDVMEARTSKKVAPKRRTSKPAGMLGVRADSPDWKSATVAIAVKTFDAYGAETVFRKGDKIDYHKFDSDRVVGAKDRSDPMTYFYVAKSRLRESVQEEIDLEVTEAMKGISGYPLVSLPAAYRFPFENDAKKFVKGIEVNYSRDVVAATRDGRLVHIEYTDPDKKIEKEVRRRVEKTARHYKAKIVAEERTTWSLDELGFQNDVNEAKMQDVFMYDFPDEKSAMKFADEIKKMNKLNAVVGYDNDVDVYADNPLLKGKVDRTAKAHGGKFTGKSQEIMGESPEKKSEGLVEVDLRDLATKGMGTLTAKQARQTVGKDQQFFSQDGGKKLTGVVVKVSSTHYTIRDIKTKKNQTFKVYDEKQAKELVTEAWTAQTVDDAAKSKYGITITPKMMRAAKKNYWHMTTTKDRGDRYRVQLQVKGDDPTYISGSADEVAAKLNDELNLTEAADDRTVVAKELKKWAKQYVEGPISVKSGSGKTPYIQLTARNGKIDNRLRKMVMDIAFPKASNVGDMDDISYGNVTDRYIAITADKWMEVMGMTEDAPATNTGGVAGTGNDPVVGIPTSKKKKKKAIARTKSMTEMNDLPKKHDLVSEYKGTKVFQISAEEFEATTNRRKYQRWTESDAFVAIKRYSHKNPGKPVIVQNEDTGEMKLVRRRMNDGRLRHNRK